MRSARKKDRPSPTIILTSQELAKTQMDVSIPFASGNPLFIRYTFPILGCFERTHRKKPKAV